MEVGSACFLEETEAWRDSVTVAGTPFFPRNVSKFLPAFHKLRAAVSKEPTDLPLWVFASPFEFKLPLPDTRKQRRRAVVTRPHGLAQCVAWERFLPRAVP